MNTSQRKMFSKDTYTSSEALNSYQNICTFSYNFTFFCTTVTHIEHTNLEKRHVQKSVWISVLREINKQTEKL